MKSVHYLSIILLFVGTTRTGWDEVKRVFKTAAVKAQSFAVDDSSREIIPNPSRYISEIEARITKIEDHLDSALVRAVEQRLDAVRTQAQGACISDAYGDDCLVVARVEQQAADIQTNEPAAGVQSIISNWFVARTSTDVRVVQAEELLAVPYSFFDWYRGQQDTIRSEVEDELRHVQALAETMRLELSLLMYRYNDYAACFSHLARANFSDKDLFPCTPGQPDVPYEQYSYEFFGFESKDRRSISYETMRAAIAREFEQAGDDEQRKRRIRQHSWFFQCPLMKQEYDRFLNGPRALQELTIAGDPPDDLVDLMGNNIARYAEAFGRIAKKGRFAGVDAQLLSMGEQEEEIRNDCAFMQRVQKEWEYVSKDDVADATCDGTI